MLYYYSIYNLGKTPKEKGILETRARTPGHGQADTDTRHGHLWRKTDTYGKDGQLWKRRTVMEKTGQLWKRRTVMEKTGTMERRTLMERRTTKHLKTNFLSFKKEAHTVL